MLDYVIFAATFVIFLIFAVVYLYPGSKRSTTIPGPEPVDPLEGNYPDIKACGSLHEFLSKVHEDYGPIVSFWLGPRLCASIASPQLFEEHSAVFDRPYDLFKAAALFWGDDSFILANGAEGRRRHNIYSKCFNITSLQCYFSIYHKLSHRIVKSWSSWPHDQFLPLFEQLSDFVVRSVVTSVLGTEVSDEKTLKSLKASLDVCWTEVENFTMDTQDADGQREKRFTQHQENLRKFVTKTIQSRRDKPPAEGEHLAIDAAIELNLPESAVVSDLLSLLCDGFIKSSALLTWACYFIASHSDVQEKARTEILCTDNLTRLTYDDVQKLDYMQKVLKETLRCATITTFAARYQEFDTMLGGHKIPAGTPVVHALGVVLHDPAVYPDPDRFDPSRFDVENESSRPGFFFEPFGFAGKRRCPGRHFVLAQAAIFLSYLLTSFNIELAPDQVVIPQYGMVIKPKDEVWIILKPIENSHKD